MPGNRNSTEIKRLVREFDERLRLARASELASGNRLLEAEEVLCPEGTGSAGASELDMLARLHVRQNRFADARRRWEQAASRDETRRAEFEECLRVLDDYLARLTKRRLIEWRVSVVMLVVSVLLVIWSLLRGGK